VAGIFQTVILGSQEGQTVQTSMGWSTPFSTTASDALKVAQAVNDAWASNFCPHLTAQYEFTGVNCFGVDDPTVGVTYNGGAAGGVDDDPLPVFLNARVTVRTGVRGRSFGGRFGIPGTCVNWLDASDSNQYSSGIVTALQGFLDSFLSDVASSDPVPDMGVISRIHNGAVRAVPIITLNSSVTVESAVGTRNSRKD
jgi:hypothetical protein